KYKKNEEYLVWLATQLTCRDLHAHYALELSVEKMSGTDEFLIDDTVIRNFWGNSIGKISMSHHWDISKLDKELGTQGQISIGDYNNIDLGYVACLLRIIDYAHINFERAFMLEKSFRLNMDMDSLIHWKAQENISGPIRESDCLKYNTMKPIDNIDAWWLFYEMSKGLSNEIHLVGDYLSSRKSSVNRFSLKGVLGITDPVSFSKYIETKGFDPIDIRFRSDSVERIVGLLGGRSLYGNDPFAPVRELLQNARDAVYLRRLKNPLINDFINIDLTNDKLSIADNGIGMDKHIITQFLLGIASSYWSSKGFIDEFGSDVSHVGKFGIGFLSVFMIANDIEIRTQRHNNPLLNLKLKGVGQRGELNESTGNFETGTKITLFLNSIGFSVESLTKAIKVIAAMIDIPISISKEGETIHKLEDDWWKNVSQENFITFLKNWRINRFPIEENRKEKYIYEYERSLNNKYTEFENEIQPEHISESYRIVSSINGGDLLIYSKGFFIQSVQLKGIAGIINIDNIELDAARGKLLSADLERTRVDVLTELKPKIINYINSYKEKGYIPSYHSELFRIGESFGYEYLKESDLQFLPMLNSLGEYKLMSYKDFVNRLKVEDEVYIGYGLGPLSIITKLINLFPTIRERGFVIPINSDNGPSFGDYRSNNEDEFISGNLQSHFETTNARRRRSNDYKEALFLLVVINAIGDAWNINEEIIANSKWYRSTNKFICTHVSKKNYT
ncbi:MAG: hypothetical protein COW78_10935, partial [Bdellovibrio sp. CG22_combo_CG10-13_8_21_14_all_39_27]